LFMLNMNGFMSNIAQFHRLLGESTMRECF